MKMYTTDFTKVDFDSAEDDPKLHSNDRFDKNLKVKDL
jgi:hypothetical protein